MMYRSTSYRRNSMRPERLLYKMAASDPRMQKQAANKFWRGLFKLGLSPFYLIGKPSMKLWNTASYKMSPKLSMHPKQMGWWGRTFGGRQKVQRNAQAIETARAARAFSQPQRDRTFLQMRRQLANATGDRRAILEANMPNFDPATGLNRGKYFMQRAPDGKMHAKKTRVQGMNEFTDFLNRGTIPQGARATSTAQQAANTAQQAAANTAQNASRAQQAAQQTAQQATQQAAQQTAQQATQAAEQAANTAAQQAPRAARPRPMRRPSNQSMSAAQWARTRQGQQDLARRQARNSAARRAQQTTQQAARTNDLNFRQPVDNGSFGPSFRQPVNNGGFGANFRQPVGQGNYSIAADNAFNTLSGRAAPLATTPGTRAAVQNGSYLRDREALAALGIGRRNRTAGQNNSYLRDREALSALGIGRRNRVASSGPIIQRNNNTDQAVERAAQNLRQQILGRNRQAEEMTREMNAHKSMPGLGGLDPLRNFAGTAPSSEATKSILANRFSDGQTFKFNPYTDDPQNAVKLINIMRRRYKHSSEDYRRLMALRQMIQAQMDS